MKRLFAAAMADILATTGTEFAGDDSPGSVLTCEWNDGTAQGPVVVLDFTPLFGTITDGALESLGQKPIDDPRFSELGVVPAVVLGCENGTAEGVGGCAVTVYGDGIDISIQVLLSAEVTQDQMVDALWSVSESIYG